MVSRSMVWLVSRMMCSPATGYPTGTLANMTRGFGVADIEERGYVKGSSNQPFILLVTTKQQLGLLTGAGAS
jgi:hypothetical protein